MWRRKENTYYMLFSASKKKVPTWQNKDNTPADHLQHVLGEQASANPPKSNHNPKHLITHV